MIRNRMRHVLGVAVAAVALLVSSSALAEDGSPIDEETGRLKSESEGESKDWEISGTVVSRIGQGTFANLENNTGTPGEKAPNSTAFDRGLMIYVLSGSYTVGDFSFSPEFTWTHWLTQGGGLNSPGEFRFQDISLSGSWSGVKIEPIDARLTAATNLSFPTSDVSQTASKILGLSGNVSLSRRFFDKLTLVGTIRGSKNFHRFKSPRVDLDKVGETNVLFRQNQAEDLGDGLVAIGGLNTEYSFGGSLALAFPIYDKLSASISYGLTKYWTYHIDNQDELKAEYADVGRGTQDLSSASVTLSYPVHKYVTLSGGIITRQPPKTSDNESFRFPFWNTQGAANNFSSIQLSVTGSY